MKSICRERPELHRYAPPRPRDGGQWALEVHLQRETQPHPEPPPSHEACDQGTRGRAGAHAGPEPNLVPGRNRHKKGQSRVVKQQAHGTHKLLLTIILLHLGSNAQRNDKHGTIREELTKLPRQLKLLASHSHARGNSTVGTTQQTHDMKDPLHTGNTVDVMPLHLGSNVQRNNIQGTICEETPKPPRQSKLLASHSHTRGSGTVATTLQAHTWHEGPNAYR
eukprot:6214408-Pleurochrysis_carterae.AAC.2